MGKSYYISFFASSFVWFHGNMQIGKYERVLVAYWQDYLQDISEQIQLPYSYQRPVELSGEVGTCAFSLSSKLASEINAFCTGLNIELDLFFLASLKLLLWKYSGQKTIVVGVPTIYPSGGPHATLLPVRSEVNDSLLVSQWFSLVHDSALACQQNSLIHFADLVEIAGVHPQKNAHPLFQIICCHHTSSIQGAIKGTILEDVYGKTGYDLSFFSSGGETLQCAFQFSSDLFSSETVKKLQTHFVEILQWLVTHIDNTLFNLSLLTKADWDFIQEVNNTKRPEFLGKTCINLFADIVAAYPEKEAVRFNGKGLTYRQLDFAASNLASILISSGVSRGFFVGVLLTRGLHIESAILGVMRCGAIYVPLDPDLPVDRLTAIVEDAGLEFIIVDRETKRSQLLFRAGLTPVEIDKNLAVIPHDELRYLPVPSDISYMIYTSGSTGKPKGVPITHEALANFLLAIKESQGVSAQDVVICLATISFDISILEMLLPVTCGAVLEIASFDIARDGNLLAGLIRDADITYMLATPVTWVSLFETGWQGKSNLKILSAGDVLSEDLAGRMLQTGAQVWNGYGPTETTMGTSFALVTKKEDLLIGKPIANISYYILDETDNYLPSGVVGELAIGGCSLSPGYHQREELTEKKFIEVRLPFSEGKQQIYKTGDLAQLTKSGDYRYFGRADSQVKIRGYRIELGEIEAQFVVHPDVIDCCCTVITYSEMDKRIVAYYKAAQPLEAKMLREFLAEKLPAYMVPVVFMYMQDFPKNQNQKIDRKALPLPGSSDFNRVQSTIVQPTSETERIVVLIWQEILHRTRFGVTDNFFDLGGYSLIAMQVIMQVQSRFAKTVSLSLLYAQPTVREFCTALDTVDADSTQDCIPLHHEDRSHWQFSPQQERLRFVQTLSGTSPAYNVVQCLLVEGELKIDFMQQAIREVVACHESLNCCLHDDGNNQYVALAPDELDIQVVDLASLDAHQQEQTMQQHLIAGNTIPKDFFARTCAVTLYLLNPQKMIVAVFGHHIFTDGVSFTVFQTQLGQVYANLQKGVAPLTNIDVQFQYSDYVQWLTQNPQNDISSSLSFWKTYLAGIPEHIQLPYSFPRPEQLNHKGDSVAFSLSSSLSGDVKKICRQLQITPFVFLLASYVLLLWKYSGQKTVVVGVPHANRGQVAFQDIVGFFVDMLPVRADVDGSLTIEQWFKAVNRSFVEGFDHAEVDFGKIVETIGHHRQLNSHPLFQVMFAYQDFQQQRLDSVDVSLKQVFMNRGVAEHDLSLYAWEDSRIHGVFEYATALFDHARITALQTHFVAIIEWAVASQDVTLNTLSLVTQTDWQKIQSSNDTARPEFLAATCLDLFARTVTSHPEKEAIRFNHAPLTYQQLDVVSDHIALELTRHKITKGSFVGVLVSRGFGIEMALLGVLKSGAAYVPLDPHFPVARLQYIVADSAMEFIIVDAENKALAEQLSVDVTVIQLGKNESCLGPQIKDVVCSPVATDLAYMIYTSGSTGQPKGVPITHESLANFLLSVSEFPGITGSDVLIGLTTTSFDISFLEMLLPVVNGATLVIADADTARNGEALGTFLDAEHVSIMQATPATWALLFASGWQGKKNLKIITGGEPLPEHLAEKLLHVGKEVWNAYGPTEATIWSSFAQVRAKKNSLIGMPMANTSFYILDEYGNQTPPGIVGELAIAGCALSPGYHNKEELSQKVFVEAVLPFAGGQQKLYRTGDLAVLTTSGGFRCLGRKDHQVKIRGFRIELGEIENKLAHHRDIVECCAIVTGCEDAKKIVAYYTSDGSPSSTDLRDYLKSALPSYMVPSRFILLESFPQTPNKKIDKKKLPLPDTQGEDELEDYVPPATDYERDLLAIWQDLLEVKNIGVTDNFFDSGGTSLSAITLIAKINTFFKTDLPLIHCFQHPTIRSFGQFLDHLRQVDAVQINCFKNLVEINSTGSQIPFVLVHGDAGNDFLPAILGEDQPFYGFIHQGADGKRMTYETVEDIARHYLKELQQVCPHGPFILSGFSFGGLVAMHMGYLLEQQGEEVRGIVLFDTFHPSVVYNHGWLAHPIKKIKIIRRYFLTEWQNRKTGLMANRCFDTGRAIPAHLRSRYIMRCYLAASKLYRPPVLTCPVSVLRSESDVTTDPYNGWQRGTTGSVTVDNVSGDHLGMMRDTVNQELLQARLIDKIEGWR